MNTTLKRYAPAILSLLVLMIGGVQGALAAGDVSWSVIVQLGILAVTSLTTYLVPLVGERWRGKAKTGLELLGVALVLAVPFVTAGAITAPEFLLVVVAFIKAAAAQLGIIIRTDEAPAAPLKVVDVTPGKASNITTLDGGPEHRAE